MNANPTPRAIEQRIGAHLDHLTPAALSAATGCEVIGTFQILGFGGRPEAAAFWLILPTEQQRHLAWLRRAEVTDRVRDLLIADGLSATSVTDISVALCSQEGIDAAGGPASYFR
jgi:hypothetical protein